MRFIESSAKTVERLLTDLRERIQANDFGIMNIHDLKSTLKNKGFDLANACYVLDVCNPQKALYVLNNDIGMNVALPCRISVYEDHGATKIAMIRPSSLLDSLSGSPDLIETAKEVEATLIKIIREAL